MKRPLSRVLCRRIPAALGSVADLTLHHNKRTNIGACMETNDQNTEMENEAETKTIRLTSESMNKAQIIVELENMVAARLFSGQPWLADGETFSAVNRKLIQMGLLEQVCVEPRTWQITPLGRELDVDLFHVFMGIICEWDMPIILEKYGLLNGSEFDAIIECTPEADAETLLSESVKRAYFDYRKAAKFLH
jgi:hypothetical protein